MTELSQYGITQQMTAGADAPARVLAVHKERYEVICRQGLCYAKLKSAVYYGAGTQAFPTVGDFVALAYNSGGDSLITQTLPRSTFFSRRSPSKNGQVEQAVAANFDIVFVMASLNKDFNLKRLERYLTLAWQSGATPVVVLTKADLATDRAGMEEAARKTAAGVDVLTVSAVTGFGMDGLNGRLKAGQTVVFLGSSGIGKSSLINAMAGKELMEVNAIREDDAKGRHTTTHRQLILLESGVMVIDTPGMRELGMWDVSVGLGEAFDDIDRLFGQCRFSDCRHESEPGCAVKAAIASGNLTEARLESYRALQREAKYTQDKEAFLRERAQTFKAISKELRQNPKYRRRED